MPARPAAPSPEQGGLVSIPHPYVPFRGSHIREEPLIGLLEAGKVDAIEVFNSRVTFQRHNLAAAEIATRYGVLTAFLGLIHYARRETFLIDPQGRIARHYRDVDPKANAGQVLSDLGRLMKPGAAGR